MNLKQRIERLEQASPREDEPVELFGIVATQAAIACIVREVQGTALRVVRPLRHGGEVMEWMNVSKPIKQLERMG